MHSASRNPFVPIANRLGFVYQSEPPGPRVHHGDRWESEAETKRARALYQDVECAAQEVSARGIDCPLADLIPTEHPDSAALAHWMSTQTAVDVDEASVIDWCRSDDTLEDWALRDGFGALVAAHGGDVPVELDCRVRHVRWHCSPLVLETDRGTLKAERVLVTVSNAVLWAGIPDFEPQLPDWKLDALAKLPLGYASKVVLEVRDAQELLPSEAYVMYGPGAPDTISFEVRPFGRDIVVGHLGGRFCQSLEAAGEAEMIAFATERLAAMYGNDIKPRIGRTASHRWSLDPHVLGAYSAARPGGADARKKLACPVDQRLFFAGEACTAEHYATAHGAHLSGQRAAEYMSSLFDA